MSSESIRERGQARSRLRTGILLGAAGALIAAGLVAMPGAAAADPAGTPVGASDTPGATATAATVAATAATAAAGTPDTLGGAAAADGRYFGAVVSGTHVDEPLYASTLDGEFTAVTPRTGMAWDVVEPAPGQFDFSAGDQVVAYAHVHGMKVRGHSLVGNADLPGWVGGLAATSLRSAMDRHIAEVAGHYQGLTYAWDVVSDAFAEDGTRRPTPLQTTLGSGYIEEAFAVARAVDSHAKLCYSDYGIGGVNAKSDAVYAMVADFKRRGVPIDCVAFESALTDQSPVPDSLRQNLQRFADLGVDVQITNLGVWVSQPADSGWAELQAQRYAHVVLACLRVSRCTGITVCGITDRYACGSADPGIGDPCSTSICNCPTWGCTCPTWGCTCPTSSCTCPTSSCTCPTWGCTCPTPMCGCSIAGCPVSPYPPSAYGTPTLFDADYQPKPAYYAVLDVLVGCTQGCLPPAPAGRITGS